jgi:hypothetical protein
MLESMGFLAREIMKGKGFLFVFLLLISFSFAYPYYSIVGTATASVGQVNLTSGLNTYYGYGGCAADGNNTSIFSEWMYNDFRTTYANPSWYADTTQRFYIYGYLITSSSYYPTFIFPYNGGSQSAQYSTGFATGTSGCTYTGIGDMGAVDTVKGGMLVFNGNAAGTGSWNVGFGASNVGLNGCAGLANYTAYAQYSNGNLSYYVATNSIYTHNVSAGFHQIKIKLNKSSDYVWFYEDNILVANGSVATNYGGDISIVGNNGARSVSAPTGSDPYRNYGGSNDNSGGLITLTDIESYSLAIPNSIVMKNNTTGTFSVNGVSCTSRITIEVNMSYSANSSTIDLNSTLLNTYITGNLQFSSSPSTLNITSPLNQSWTNSTNISVNYTLDFGTNTADQCWKNVSGYISSIGTLIATGNYTFYTDNLTEGSNQTVSLICQFAGTNYTSLILVNYDATIPRATVNFPSNLTNVGENTTFSLNFTVSDNLGNISALTYLNEVLFANNSSLGNNTIVYLATVGNLTLGINTITINTTDQAGNKNTTILLINKTDTVSPSIESFIISSQDFVAPENITATAIITDGTQNGNATLYINGTNYGLMANSTALSTNNTFTLTIQWNQSGIYDAYVISYDAAGNSNTSSNLSMNVSNYTLSSVRSMTDQELNLTLSNDYTLNFTINYTLNFSIIGNSTSNLTYGFVILDSNATNKSSNAIYANTSSGMNLTINGSQTVWTSYTRQNISVISTSVGDVAYINVSNMTGTSQFLRIVFIMPVSWDSGVSHIKVESNRGGWVNVGDGNLQQGENDTTLQFYNFTTTNTTVSKDTGSFWLDLARFHELRFTAVAGAEDTGAIPVVPSGGGGGGTTTVYNTTTSIFEEASIKGSFSGASSWETYVAGSLGVFAFYMKQTIYLFPNFVWAIIILTAIGIISYVMDKMQINVISATCFVLALITFGVFVILPMVK